MFEVELNWSIMELGLGFGTHFVEATNSGHEDTMIELEHCSANLLQQWGIVWLDIVLRRQRVRSDSTLRHIFELERRLPLRTSALQLSVPYCTYK